MTILLPKGITQDRFGADFLASLEMRCFAFLYFHLSCDTMEISRRDATYVICPEFTSTFAN